MSQNTATLGRVYMVENAIGQPAAVVKLDEHTCWYYRPGHKVHPIQVRLAMSEPIIGTVTDIEILNENSFECSVNGERIAWFNHNAQAIPVDQTAVLRGHSVIQFLDESGSSSLITYAKAEDWRVCLTDPEFLTNS
ncbi:hypothetical protein [Neomicrococcus aestuarii]|uniref:Uncharacterized protein n=1 Tax=Neomicrococcus aestuarii TaxID=556325 RepID=A0A1L2ZMT3_9MICC|nr:hypothetical protein [Neomicrococcus aestuarii]APF40341.1 hypothetical protein BHE16_04155 [Neomicrococcus aestuarii]MBB5511594.1 hypothetical protein [Neomicrococcus aestuarii]